MRLSKGRGSLAKFIRVRSQSGADVIKLGPETESPRRSGMEPRNKRINKPPRDSFAGGEGQSSTVGLMGENHFLEAPSMENISRRLMKWQSCW